MCVCVCVCVIWWADGVEPSRHHGRRGSTGEVTPSKSSGSGWSMTVWLVTQYSVGDHWGRAAPAHAGVTAGLQVSMYLFLER